MNDPLLDRMTRNAQGLIEQYDTANHLLNDAVKDAMTWGPSLITTGRTPSLAQLERLATQILAILMVGVKRPKPEEQHG